MEKFNVGDKVECIKEFEPFNQHGRYIKGELPKVGHKYTIKKMSDFNKWLYKNGYLYLEELDTDCGFDPMGFKLSTNK